jgi:hypothetical protein
MRNSEIHAFTFPRTAICQNFQSDQQISYKVYYDQLNHLWKIIQLSSIFQLYNFESETSFEKTDQDMYIEPYQSSIRTVLSENNYPKYRKTPSFK